MHNNVHTHTFKLCLKENRPKKVEKQGDFLAAAALKNIIACKRLIRLVFHKFRCSTPLSRSCHHHLLLRVLDESKKKNLLWKMIHDVKGQFCIQTRSSYR